MQDALTVYFNGEKHAGLLLAGLAVAGLIAAVIMWRAGSPLRSFAATIGILALAEVALGVGLYLRTGPQVSRLDGQLRSDALAYYSAEAPRMLRVQRNFVIIEYVELAIIVTAAIAALALKSRSGPAGIALGLLVHASILLAFDVFAERRGAEYVSALAAARRSG